MSFIHIQGIYSQTGLRLQPINSYTVPVLTSGISSFINFFPRVNTAQVYYYPNPSGYQPNIAFFNGSSIHGSFNVPYSFPSIKSLSFFYPSLISVSPDRSIVSSSQGGYSSLLDNNSFDIFLPNRVSTANFYYNSNFISSTSANIRNSGYSALFSPFYPFVNGSQVFTSFVPFNAKSTNWFTPEISIPTTSVPVYFTYNIVNIYPHDPDAFTQGLVYENGFLYEGTGIYKESTLRKVDLETGNILQIIDLHSKYFGEGITIFGNRIIQLTWLHNVGFVYDKSTFELVQEFYYPTEGWGITHNGKSLIMSDGTSTLHFLDPVTFAETSIVEVYDTYGPVSFLNELEYIQGEIYANVFKTGRIARISPITGKVLGWIDLKGLLSPEDVVSTVDVLNGIAFDPKLDRLFVTGKFWPKLFEIDLVIL